MIRNTSRFRRSLELLVSLKSARNGTAGLPKLDVLRQVQRAAHDTGGLPALVAEIVAAYTGLVDDQAAPSVLAGREFRGFDRDGSPRGGDATYGRLSLDLALARIAVRLVASREEKAESGIRALELLAHDLVVQGQIGTGATQAVVDRLRSQMFRSQGEVLVGPSGAVVSRSRQSPMELARQSARMTIGEGLTHARLAAAGRWGNSTLTITHWETARAVSPAVSGLISSIVQIADRDTDRIDEQAKAIGIAPSLLRELLPSTDSAIAPLAKYVRGCDLEVEARPPGVPVVHDTLGLIYGIASLAGTTRLMIDAPRIS